MTELVIFLISSTLGMIAFTGFLRARIYYRDCKIRKLEAKLEELNKPVRAGIPCMCGHEDRSRLR